MKTPLELSIFGLILIGAATGAVTFHRFLVKQTPTGWIAEVFLDLYLVLVIDPVR